MVQDGVELVPALWATLAAVAGFCATASGFYAINDALDATSSETVRMCLDNVAGQPENGATML